VTASPLLDGIDLVVFDKDGTLIDFGVMWGDWARELGTRLEAAARRPVAPDVWAAIGFDPTSGRVAPRGLLAEGTMSSVADRVAAVMRRWCPSVAAAHRVVEAAWFVPDPAKAARPLANLEAVFSDLHGSGRLLAVITNDDRAPTLLTLAALDVAALVDDLVCADDGLPVKPAPDAVLALCTRLHVAPQRAAMVGDLPVDLAMGRAAGAGRVIGVTSGLGSADDLEPLADAVVGSVAELITTG
jgi:phosphoglycolate phosphatase